MRRVLVPLDGSLRAEYVLPFVTRLSDFHVAHVILAHVITGLAMPLGALTPAQDVQLAIQLVEHRRDNTLRYLEALHRLIEEENIDLVVMCAHGYSANADWPYGSLTTNFITHCATALLIVQDIPAAPSVNSEEGVPRGLLTVRHLED